MVTFQVVEDGRVILVSNDGRCLSSSDAYWNLAGFPKHQSSHVVVRLSIHMPGGQTILFREGMEEEAIHCEAAPQTRLTAFFRLNWIDATAYTCVQILMYYTWHKRDGMAEEVTW